VGTQTIQPPAAGRPEIPGYELLDALGHGPLGVVFRARTAAGGSAAVKVFNPVVRWRPDFASIFEQDTGIAASLRHANVVGLQHRGRAGEDYFIAYELMPARSVREKIRAGPMGVRQALRVGVDVARALEHAHQRRMLHRGLKPENVFLTAAGMARVSDFSQARLAGQELQVGRYSPPEQRRMTPQKDGRADLWAAAFIVYELITCQAPLTPLQPLANRVPGADDRLDAFFQRAFAANPEERFLRAGELASAITELLERDGPSASGAHDSPVVVTVEKNVAYAYVRPCSAEALELGLKLVEQALQAGPPPGRWRLAYDLSGVPSMGTMENVALIQLHERCRERLEAVYFHSPIAHVRGSAMVVGGSVQGLPFRVFESAESLRRGLQEPRP